MVRKVEGRASINSLFQTRTHTHTSLSVAMMRCVAAFFECFIRITFELSHFAVGVCVSYAIVARSELDEIRVLE